MELDGTFRHTIVDLECLDVYSLEPLVNESSSSVPVLMQDLWGSIFSLLRFDFTMLFDFSVVCKQWCLIIHSEQFLSQVRAQLVAKSGVCLLEKASTKWILSAEQLEIRLRHTSLRRQKILVTEETRKPMQRFINDILAEVDRGLTCDAQHEDLLSEMKKQRVDRKLVYYNGNFYEMVFSFHSWHKVSPGFGIQLFATNTVSALNSYLTSERFSEVRRIESLVWLRSTSDFKIYPVGQDQVKKSPCNHHPAQSSVRANQSYSTSLRALAHLDVVELPLGAEFENCNANLVAPDAHAFLRFLVQKSINTQSRPSYVCTYSKTIVERKEARQNSFGFTFWHILQAVIAVLIYVVTVIGPLLFLAWLLFSFLAKKYRQLFSVGLEFRCLDVMLCALILPALLPSIIIYPVYLAAKHLSLSVFMHGWNVDALLFAIASLREDFSSGDFVLDLL